MSKLKIMGLPGSLRANSSSHVILQEVGRLLATNADFEIYGGVGALPHFDGRDEDAPDVVLQFRRKIREADAVVICTPEYAFGVPGSLKNALDWTVGSGEFVNKPVALITASSQGEKAHQAFQWILGAISANLAPDHTLLISFIRSKVKDGRVTEGSTQAEIVSLAERFLKSLQKEGN
ncbi:MAG: NADPH-dependent FMN reductase [Bacteroidota bacterium]